MDRCIENMIEFLENEERATRTFSYGFLLYNYGHFALG